MTSESSTSSPVADAAMGRYAQGDEAAFAEVYDCVGPRIYGFLLRKTDGNTVLTEDLTQQTFLQMHRARGRYIEGASVMSWACAIAHRLTIDHFRKTHRRARHHGEAPAHAVDVAAPSGEQVMVALQTQDAIKETLDALPQSQRTAFELVKREGLTQSEAAEVMGVTIASIKALTHRAYKALRSVLESGGAP